MKLEKNSKSVVISQYDSKLHKLFCTCGYVGRSGRGTSCNKCFKPKADIHLHGRSDEKIASQKIHETDDFIKSSILINKYKISGDRMYDVPFKDWDYTIEYIEFDICMDKKTGDSWIEVNGQKLYILDQDDDFHSGDLLIYWHDLLDLHDLLPELVTRFFEARKLSFEHFHSFDFNDLEKAFCFLRYPSLQFLEFEELNIPTHKRITAALDQATGKIDLIKRLTGHGSKKIRELAESVRLLNFLILWGPHIKHPENILHITNEFEPAYFDYEPNLFDFTEREDEFETGINLIKELHNKQEEKVWIHRVVKAMSDFYHEDDWEGDWENEEMDLDELTDYIADIGNMYTDIMENKQDYVVPFDGDIRKLHDTLSSDYEKLQIVNRIIPYTEDEKTLEKEISENLCFSLVPDTHYLVEVGSRMNICVGSYGDYAYSKQCDIIVLKENEQPLVCIEIRGKKLVQAKTKHNGRPNKKLKNEIITWCKENKIKYDNCYDIA
jgi:hypothetical protein